MGIQRKKVVIWILAGAGLLGAGLLVVNSKVRIDRHIGDAWVTDTLYRWTRRPVKRSVFEAERFFASGPLSESGKPHGKWHFTYYADALPLDERFRDVWYWYGEEVTEGEWHIRDK